MRLLLENKASIGSAPLLKFWQFISKSVFDNPATFVVNGRYYYVRGDERNFMELRDATYGGRRRRQAVAWPRAATTAKSVVPRRAKLLSSSSASSEPITLALVWGWRSDVDDHTEWPWVRDPREEREIEIEGERELRKKERGKERRRGRTPELVDRSSPEMVTEMAEGRDESSGGKKKK